MAKLKTYLAWICFKLGHGSGRLSMDEKLYSTENN